MNKRLRQKGPACTLCGGNAVRNFYRAPERVFYLCLACQLVFADPATRLSPEEEKARYLQHRNSPEDKRYRAFLNRLAEPLAELLGRRPLSGLDFGCGPGPTLSVILTEKGYAMEVYDPYFYDNTALLARQYDFITCTEVVEHLYAPGREWRQLPARIRPGGWLGVMTRMTGDRPDKDAFRHWHYRRDPTHVSFFSRETFRYLGRKYRLEPSFIGDDVILLRKRGRT